MEIKPSPIKLLIQQYVQKHAGENIFVYEIADAIHINTNTASRNLNEMIRKGYIRKVGKKLWVEKVLE